MNDVHSVNKSVVAKLRGALYDLDPARLLPVFQEVLAPDCTIRFCHPFGDLHGPRELYEAAYLPLIAAIPDLERRDFIVIAGPSSDRDGTSTNWVGCAGHYTGVFTSPWLDIPPTFHPVAMRFHEFFRVHHGRIVEIHALWDIPQVMMQARAWPLSPSLGVEWIAPAPTPQNGIPEGPREETEAGKSLSLVRDMLAGLQKHADGGPEAMNLSAFWHPKMTWYGPAGIGTNRRISGFRNWHQIPFLKAMPDRQMNDAVPHYFFAEGSFTGTTGWPNMRATVTGDGWLGIAPGAREITMRSLDFWRREGDLLRENWVLVDLLHVYHQLGVNVFDRMREFTVDRQERRPQL